MVQSFVFTIEEINSNPHLLPNVTLGFAIWDSGSSELGALWGTMALLTGQGYPIPNYSCALPEAPLAAILGEDRSTLSIAMATWLGLYRIPQVSYGSTVSVLSDKKRFPSFLRTVPPDKARARGMARLAAHLAWYAVGLVAQDDEYGQLGARALRLELEAAGLCVYVAAELSSSPNPEKLRKAAHTLAAAQPRVLLVFSRAQELLLLAAELQHQGASGRGHLWISSEVWDPTLLAPLSLGRALNGALSFSAHRGRIPGFADFLGRLHPARSPEDKFLQLFWEETFLCQWFHNSSSPGWALVGGGGEPGVLLGGEEGGRGGGGRLGRVGRQAEAKSGAGRGAHNCTGEETLQGQDLPFLDMSDLSVTYAVANAVASVAHALHNLATCEAGDGPFVDGECADMRNFQPWQILYYLRRVRFRNSYGEEVLFDANGDPPALYDVMRWQPGPRGYPPFQEIARFNDTAAQECQLQINASGLTLERMEEQVSSSICQETCPPGTWRTSQIGQASCCFACPQCPVGQVSELKADAPACKKCPDDTLWPSPSRDRCELQPAIFLQFGDPLGAALASLGICVSLATGVVLAIFVCHRHTPLVRASSPGLSALLLTCLLLSSLSSLLFLGHRGPFDCRLRQVALSLTFPTAISCVLARTATVLVAFRAVRPGSPLQICLGPGLTRALVAGPLMAQAGVCIVWLGVASPSQRRSLSLAPNTVSPECLEALTPGFWGLLGLLALAGFVLALLTRRLPGGFCEAHLLTLSMAVCVSVWLASLPAQIHSRGRAVAAAVQAFSILASNAALLGFIFLPRCVIILLQPHRNNRAWLMGRPPAL
ncbi:extracellular calcium-sensing receptor-like [Dromiciops gliroides]|uniref:extracellular calcium-sensing receptor-like n=1 Tax=Dromiciops gliroides TaxID=33562 RepID=UPI001CC62E19|nr:extracellular calcium-sensing receptor-like [Dromiciops gliroides]